MHPQGRHIRSVLVARRTGKKLPSVAVAGRQKVATPCFRPPRKGNLLPPHPAVLRFVPPAARLKETSEMGLMRRRSTLALAGSATLAAMLAACGGSSGGGSASGGAGSGAGKTLHVLVGVNPQFPTESKAWQQGISAQFKAQTGADVQWEYFASANEEVTKVETSVVSGNG